MFCEIFVEMAISGYASEMLTWIQVHQRKVYYNTPSSGVHYHIMIMYNMIFQQKTCLKKEYHQHVFCWCPCKRESWWTQRIYYIFVFIHCMSRFHVGQMSKYCTLWYKNSTL